MAARYLRLLVLMPWIGGMVFTGAVAVPVMFAVLEPAHAGTAAAAVFRAVGWLSLPAALIYLALLPGGQRRGPRLWLCAASVLLLALAVFMLGDAMAQIRAAQGPGSVPAWLHRLATFGYLGACMLGIALVWCEAAATDRISPKAE